MVIKIIHLKAVGVDMKKRAFTQSEVKKIETFIRGVGTQQSLRDLAIFRLGIDSMLRVSDLLMIKTDEIYSGSEVRKSFQVKQLKTNNMVRCEISDKTRQVIQHYVDSKNKNEIYLFTGRKNTNKPITCVQWSRLIKHYVTCIGIDPVDIGTHSTRKTIPTIAYKRSGGNLKAVSILLGHKNLNSTVHYLSIDENEAFSLKLLINI